MFKYIKDKINKVDKKTKIVFGLFAIGLMLVTRGTIGNIGTPSEFVRYFDEDSLVHRIGKVLIADRILSQYVGMVSIADHGQIDIPEELIGHAGRDIGFTKDEKVFSWFPIGLQIITVPFYWVGKIFNMSLLFSHFPIIIFSFINLILLYQISRNIFKLKQKIGLLVSYIYGFSSVALVYSVAYISHQISTFLLLSCFYLAWKFFKTTSVKKKVLSVSLIWFLWSTSSFFDYPNWVIVLPVFVYILFKIISRRNKKEFLILLFTSIIGILGLFGQGIYNHVVYDNWKQMSNTLPQYTWKIDGSIQDKTSRFDEITERKNNIVKILRVDNLKKGLSVLLISMDRGLFIFTPVLLISLLGYFYYFRKKIISHEKIFLLYAPIFTILVYAMFGDPWGGWAFGSRYLLPVMAIMSISIGVLWRTIKNIYFRSFIIVLTVYSLLQSVAGVMSTSVNHPGDNTWVNGIHNFYFLYENVSGNFIYNMFLSSLVPVFSLYMIALMFFIGVLVYILKK